MKNISVCIPLTFVLMAFLSKAIASEYIFEAGHASLQKWSLGEVPYPENNKPTEARVELGMKLFFDPRLSGDGNMSCASCHSPLLGWSDGLPTTKGFKSKVLDRASPTLINVGYNSLQQWDGRAKTLELQAIGPIKSKNVMNMDVKTMIDWLNANNAYRAAFETAYPGEGINEVTVTRAIAAYERTLVSKESPFDAWLKGDKTALDAAELRGFKLFVDAEKGNCAACHTGGNFTDNGFHNIGLKSFGEENPDVGRYKQKPIKVLMGAFKTPTVRDVEFSAPYFHDGSAATLEEVVEHYAKGGEVKTNLSRNIKRLDLTAQDKSDLVAFMKSLSSPKKAYTLPVLP